MITSITQQHMPYQGALDRYATQHTLLAPPVHTCTTILQRLPAMLHCCPPVLLPILQHLALHILQHDVCIALCFCICCGIKRAPRAWPC